MPIPRRIVLPISKIRLTHESFSSLLNTMSDPNTTPALNIKSTFPISSTGTGTGSRTVTHIPRLGFGVYKLRHATGLNACLAALDAGYRHIDCAQLYRNEDLIREAVAQSAVPRGDIFLTSKFNPNSPAEVDPYRSILDSVERLDGPGGYADLFLLHIPGRTREKTQAAWSALERLQEQGRVKAIGVSNFHINHLEEMREYAREWPPSVNQIELHPWCQQKKLVSYCQENHILVQAYSPLLVGSRLDDPTLAALAAKYDRSPAQILLRWSLQRGFIPLPKSQTPERITENARVFDFELSSSDMASLDSLDQGAKGALFPSNVS